jgi:hypothetical protein
VNRHSPIPPLRLLLPGNNEILKVIAKEINHSATPPDARRWLTQLLRELNKSDPKGSYPGFIRGRLSGVTAARLANRIEGELKKMTIELDERVQSHNLAATAPGRARRLACPFSHVRFRIARVLTPTIAGMPMVPQMVPRPRSSSALLRPCGLPSSFLSAPD